MIKGNYNVNGYDAVDIVLQSLDAENKGNQFLRGVYIEGLRLYPDIFAPSGIESFGLKGKTVIEIKRFLSFSNVNKFEFLFKKER